MRSTHDRSNTRRGNKSLALGEFSLQKGRAERVKESREIQGPRLQTNIAIGEILHIAVNAEGKKRIAPETSRAQG